MKVKKWLTTAAAVTGSLMLFSSVSFAADTVKSDLLLRLGGKDVEFAGQSYLVDSSLYAPYEAVAKHLGAEANWNASAQTLSLNKAGNTLEWIANKTSVKVNGVELTTSSPLQLIGSTVLVPVRFIYETLGYTIGYDAKLRSVSLAAELKPGIRVVGVENGQYIFSNDLKITVVPQNHTWKDPAANKDAKAGEGHVLVWLDGAKDPVKSFKGEAIQFSDLALGEHTLTVQLVGNDQKPLQTDVKQTITFQKAKLSILADLDPDKATGMRIEGVIADAKGRVFTAESDAKKLYRVMADSGKTEVLTVLPRAATGLGLDAAGNLYLASGAQEGVILRVLAKDLDGGPFDTSKVETYVSGVQGANGMAFDAKGNLYISGGANGNVYMVTPDGKLNTFKSGIQPERTDQLIVVNGVAFGKDGKLYLSNTSSGEINRFALNADGSLGAVEQVAKSPLLYGADGINFGPDGALYVAANERNAIVRVTVDGKVSEVAQNGNNGPLEFPASLHFVDNNLYISNFDQPRGDNKPNEPGIGASVAKIEFGAAK